MAPEQINVRIKTEVTDPSAASWFFEAQKTMYGGNGIGKGDVIFVFDSETEGSVGQIASSVVSAVEAIPRSLGLRRQTPRVNIAVIRKCLANDRLGRTALSPFADWLDGRPQTELNFKLYRQRQTSSSAFRRL